jgi:hypothetical protein
MTRRKDSSDKSAGTEQYGKYNKESNDAVVDTRYRSIDKPADARQLAKDRKNRRHGARSQGNCRYCTIRQGCEHIVYFYI